jgi:hypothetical protein
MLEALLATIRLDEFLIALAGQMATEASARFALTSAKALAVAMFAVLVQSAGAAKPTPAPKRCTRKAAKRKLPASRTRRGVKRR